jgi:hypothetical protein
MPTSIMQITAKASLNPPLGADFPRMFKRTLNNSLKIVTYFYTSKEHPCFSKGANKYALYMEEVCNLAFAAYGCLGPGVDFKIYVGSINVAMMWDDWELKGIDNRKINYWSVKLSSQSYQEYQ